MAKRRLSIRHIEAFRSVSVSGSMTDAAKQLHTSQPQISRLMSQLEAIIGFPLFHRNGSRLSATVEGLQFAREVEQTFAGLSALETAAQRIRSFNASRLTVAAMPRLAGGLLAHAVGRFKQEFPDVVVSIQSGDATSVLNWIRSGLCDAGLAMLYSRPLGVRVDPIVSMDCVAVMPKDHPLSALEQLTPADFDGQRFVSPTRNNEMREEIDAVFAEHQCRPFVTAEASLGASVCALVSEGVGISLINPLAADDERIMRHLEVRPFAPPISFDIALLYPERAVQTRLVETFSRFVVEVMQDLPVRYPRAHTPSNQPVGPDVRP